GGGRARSREMLGKTAVRPLLNRVVQTVCIFTAGSRELLGSRAVRKTVGHRSICGALFLSGGISPLGVFADPRGASPVPPARFTRVLRRGSGRPSFCRGAGPL